jgi:leucine-rich repeat protein SHOC2
MPIQDPRIAARIADCRQHRKTELNLQGTHSRSFPREILEFHWLRHLNIPGNLRTLPAGIDALSELETLRLGTVHRLPKTIGNLPKLQSLLFNSLQCPPEGIQHAQQIRKLSLIYSKTPEVPTGIGALKNLEELNLHGGFRLLPPEIGALSALRILRLDQNALTELPSTLAHLSRLERLYVAQNQLRSLPNGLAALTALRSLDLTWNKLETLPDDLGPFMALTYLSVQRNRLQTLPAVLLQAPQLKNLYLNDNPWMFLPDLSALTELEGSLSIGGVKSLPLGLSRLKKVESLTLNTTPLIELPVEIAQMTRLQTLNAARCGLERVHPALGTLKHLRHLDLSNNRLSRLPASLASLPLGPNADAFDGDDSAYSHTPGLQLAGNPIPQAIIDAEPAVQIAALSR